MRTLFLRLRCRKLSLSHGNGREGERAGGRDGRKEGRINWLNPRLQV